MILLLVPVAFSLYYRDYDGLYNVNQNNSSKMFGRQIQYCNAEQFLFVSDPGVFPFPDLNVQGAVYVYRWSITNQKFEHLTTISLEGTGFEYSSEFGRSFVVESDCRTVYVALNDGVFVFKQSSYDKFVMASRPIQRQDPDFGLEVFYETSPIITTTNNIYSATSNNLIYSVSETPITCKDGLSKVMYKNTSIFVLCEKSNVLNKYHSENFTLDHSYDLPDDSTFTVSDDASVVIAENGTHSVIYTGKHKKMLSKSLSLCSDEPVRSFSLKGNVLAAQRDLNICFSEIDILKATTREHQLWEPCPGKIHNSQFINDELFVANCEGERLIRGCRLTVSLSSLSLLTCIHLVFVDLLLVVIFIVLTIPVCQSNAHQKDPWFVKKILSYIRRFLNSARRNSSLSE